MTLSFKGGVWNGLSFEANVAPQFIDVHGAMHASTDSPELAETLLMSDAKGTKYQVLDTESDAPDTVEYGPTE